MARADATQWLNYHHLFYFWTVVRAGSVSRASKQMKLAQPTVSTQLKTLESALGERLLERVGRGVVPTDAGRVVYGYAEEIFGLGHEMLEVLRGRPVDRIAPLHVGISDVVPKLIAYRLLAPALALAEENAIQLVCREDKTERLLAELSVNGLDLVISDEPLPASLKVKAYNHLLGECGLTFFATPRLVQLYRAGFPRSLDGAPMVLPGRSTQARRSIDQWLQAHKIRPRIVAEVDDSALLKVFGEHGAGVFAGPRVIETDIREQYAVGVVGRTDEVREQFYVISVERRVKQPVLVHLIERGRGLFARPSKRKRARGA